MRCDSPEQIFTMCSQSQRKWQRRSTALVRSLCSLSRKRTLSGVTHFSSRYALQNTHRLVIRIRGGDLSQQWPHIKTVRPRPGREIGRLNSYNRYLNRYTGLNYLFDLNKSLALDALTVGNETRYLNHSKDSNVTAFGKSSVSFSTREGNEPRDLQLGSSTMSTA